MRPEEITADIPEEKAPEETAAEEEAPKETVTEETVTEEETSEETTQEETITEKETIRDREKMPGSTDTAPASGLEYDVFEQILAEQQAANTLLVRITNQNDLFLGIGIALIICCVCYSVLERFTRF